MIENTAFGLLETLSEKKQPVEKRAAKAGWYRSGYKRLKSGEKCFDRMTLTERRVLDLMCEHYDIQVVSTVLGRSYKTVSTHMSRVRAYMGYSNVLELVLKYDRWKRAQCAVTQ